MPVCQVVRLPVPFGRAARRATLGEPPVVAFEPLGQRHHRLRLRLSAGVRRAGQLVGGVAEDEHTETTRRDVSTQAREETGTSRRIRKFRLPTLGL
jgi:hypothetical protein